MAKNMARIDNGIVVNIQWCSDVTRETDVLKDMGDRPVAIGDTYSEGEFYHDGEKVLTELEYTQAQLADAEQALAILYGGVTV